MHCTFDQHFCNDLKKQQLKCTFLFPLYFFFCHIFLYSFFNYYRINYFVFLFLPHLLLFVEVQIHREWKWNWVFTCRVCDRTHCWAGTYLSACAPLPVHSSSAILPNPSAALPLGCTPACESFKGVLETLAGKSDRAELSVTDCKIQVVPLLGWRGEWRVC